VDESKDAESSDNGHAELHDGEQEREEVYDESEQYADVHEYPHAHDDGADAQETDQVVDANDESESVIDADAVHEGTADPESTNYKEHDELSEEDDISGDVEAPSSATASTPLKENISSYAEPDVLTEVREPATADESSQFNESEGKLLIVCFADACSTPPPERQASNVVFSGSGSDYGDENVTDGFSGSFRSSYSFLICLNRPQRMPKLRLTLLAKILFNPLIPRTAFRMSQTKTNKVLLATMTLMTPHKPRQRHGRYQHMVNS
jgi:hypothetical protein